MVIIKKFQLIIYGNKFLIHFWSFWKGTTWILQKASIHNHEIVDISANTSEKSAWIHLKFRDENDRMLKFGLTQMKCLTSCKLLLVDPLWSDYKHVLPSLLQITNRKKVLGRLGIFSMDTVSEVQVLICTLIYHYSHIYLTISFLQNFIGDRKVSNKVELLQNILMIL